MGGARYSRIAIEHVIVDARKTSAEVAVSRAESLFRLTRNEYFMELVGPASYQKKRSCQKKLCFVATDQSLLADVLRQLAERSDCYYVKYSVTPRDGMYLGRCFLVDEYQIGVLWAKYKEHPRLFCSVQDDEFTLRFRPVECRELQDRSKGVMGKALSSVANIVDSGKRWCRFRFRA